MPRKLKKLLINMADEKEKSLIVSYKNWKALIDIKIDLKFSSIDKMFDVMIPKLKKILKNEND